MAALVRTALEAAIKQACDLPVNIQQTFQKKYTNILQLLGKSGFIASINDEIATKLDIFEFIKTPRSTVDSYIRSHSNEINPIKFDYTTIKQSGLKATRLNGYSMEDVGKIVLGIDSVVGLELKQKVFGEVEELPEENIDWQEALPKVFEGFNLQQNYRIGKYTVDFFVDELNLVLNRDYSSYIKQHYNLVNFSHDMAWEKVVNQILRV